MRSIAVAGIAGMLLYCASAATSAAPAVQFGADWRALDLHTCTGEAMQAMSQQDFINATRESDSAWGFDEQSIVLVRCIPQNQGVFIEVLTASRSPQEAERLRNEIRVKVFDAQRADPAMLFPDFYNGDSGLDYGRPHPRPRGFPQMHWGSDTRPKSVAKCVQDAQVAMSENGLQAAPDGATLVWGTSGEAIALASCVPIDSGVSILIAVTSDDGALAERLRNAVRARTFDRPVRKLYKLHRTGP